MQTTQYRIAFLAFENVNGDVRKVQHSTKWFNSLAEAKGSRWMREEAAKLVTRTTKANKYSTK